MLRHLLAKCTHARPSICELWEFCSILCHENTVRFQKHSGIQVQNILRNINERCLWVPSFGRASVSLYFVRPKQIHCLRCVMLWQPSEAFVPLLVEIQSSWVCLLYLWTRPNVDHRPTQRTCPLSSSLDICILVSLDALSDPDVIRPHLLFDLTPTAWPTNASQWLVNSIHTRSFCQILLYMLWPPVNLFRIQILYLFLSQLLGPSVKLVLDPTYQWLFYPTFAPTLANLCDRHSTILWPWVIVLKPFASGVFQFM